MHPQWRLPRHGKSPILVLLTWLLASLATAALAHVIIDLLGAMGVGGDAYDDHAHGSVVPVGVGALGLITTLLLRSAALRIGRHAALDPALLLARRFGKMPAARPATAVAVGGLATLIAMEFTEQSSALGHIEGVGDALGGNALVGLAIIACVATALTLLGLRCANALLEATVATAGALYAWIVVKPQPLVDDATILRRSRRRHRRCTTSDFLAQCHGLRAPPLTIV